MSEAGQTFQIGRGNESDLLLAHPSVSRRHAELMLGADGSVNIRDLESTGGTFVLRDGKEVPVVRASLRQTDRLRFGDYEISVADLLALVPEGKRPAGLVVHPPRPDSDVAAAPPTAERPRTRMVRCDCGTIKERDKACPACGS